MTLKQAGLLKQYFRNILIGIDQLGSSLLGGDPDETISSRVGKWAATGSRLGRAVECFIDFLFWKGHCKECIEPDEGKNKIL